MWGKALIQIMARFSFHANDKLNTKAIIIFFLSVTCMLPCVASAQEAAIHSLVHAPYQEAVKVGTISNPSIDEASGLAASYQNRDILWVVNDGGNPPTLFALSPQGETIAEFNVENGQNRDWEDLASFSLNNTNYIMIADVGDNFGMRSFYSLYVVKDPDIRKIRLKNGNLLRIVWQIKFQYEDGSKDCEAIAVDTQQKRILLLSKRTKPPILFELPLTKRAPDTILTARPIARLNTLPQPTKDDLKYGNGKYRSLPTAMDLSPDGRTLVILTYQHAYYYRRNANQTWADTFLKKPGIIPLPQPNTGELKLREALCIDPRNGELFVTSEYASAQIYSIKPAGK